jgi:DNA-binding GntR family transcriptional regulator
VLSNRDRVKQEVLVTAMDRLPALASDTRIMLGDEIYAVLLQSIMDGTIPPDERLNAGELGRRFHVSPTPIREALARLESDGLVEKLPLKGYRTTDLLDRRELLELFELRLLLEPGSAARAAERRTASEVADLDTEIAAAHAALDQPDAYRLLSHHDVRLHDLVFRAARNETVRQAYTRTHCHLHTFRLAYTGAYVSDTIDEHAAVAAGIAAGDPEKAEGAMRTHIIRSLDRMITVFG